MFCYSIFGQGSHLPFDLAAENLTHVLKGERATAQREEHHEDQHAHKGGLCCEGC